VTLRALFDVAGTFDVVGPGPAVSYWLRFSE